MTGHIFISYSKKDREFVERLANDLIDAKFKVWFDREISGGDAWRETIMEKLRSAEEVVVVISPNSVSSEWVQYETALAEGANIPIKPIQYKSVDDLPIWAQERHYIDFEKFGYDEGLSQLIASLTPPNIYQDLLEQQVLAYQQTGDLLGEDLLSVLEENFETLTIDLTSQELFQKSQQRRYDNQRAQKRNQRLLRGGIVGLSILFIVAIILTGFSLSQTRKLQISEVTAQVAATEANQQRATAEVAAVEANYQASIAQTQQALAETQARVMQSQQLSAFVQLKKEVQLDLALLLGVASIHLDNNYYSQGGLLSANQYNPDLLHYFHGHSDSVNSLAVSNDGKWLATSSCSEVYIITGWGLDCDATEIRLWDIKNNMKLEKVLLAHPNTTISHLVFNADSTQLLSSGCLAVAVGGCIRSGLFVWDIKTGDQIAQVKLSMALSSLFLSPDNEYAIAVGCSSQGYLHCSIGKMVAINLETQNIDWEKSWDGFIPRVAFHPNGDWFVSSICLQNSNSYGCVRSNIELWNVYDLSHPVDSFIEQLGGITSLAFSPGGAWLASGNSRGVIQLFEFRDREQIKRELVINLNPIKQVVFSPTGNVLIGINEDTILAWDFDKLKSSSYSESDQVSQILYTHSDWIEVVAFDPDGQILFSGGNDSIAVALSMDRFYWSMEPFHIGCSDGEKIKLSPDGKLIAKLCQNKITLYEVESGEFYLEMIGEEKIKEFVFGPDSTLIATMPYSGEYVEFWDLATEQKFQEIILDAETRNMFTDHENSYLITFSYDEVVFWDWQTFQPVVNHLVDFNNAEYAIINQGGDILAGWSGGTINLWDINENRLLNEGEIYQIFFESIVFSENGQNLYAGTYDGKIKIIDVQTGLVVDELIVESGARVNDLAISSSGNLLASAQEDGTVILWDLSLMQKLGAAFAWTESSQLSLGFSPDGKLLVSMDSKGKIYFLNMQVEAWIEIACQRAGRNFTLQEWRAYFPNEDYHITCPDNYVPDDVPASFLP